MSMMITGIGTALPPHRISQADAAAIAKQFACETAAQEHCSRRFTEERV